MKRLLDATRMKLGFESYKFDVLRENMEEHEKLSLAVSKAVDKLAASRVEIKNQITDLSNSFEQILKEFDSKIEELDSFDD